MKDQKFYVCEICGNLVGMIQSSGVIMECCGQPMTELKANTVDASLEKHVPVVNVSGERVEVQVGSVEHPMTAEHSIQWIYLKTENGGQRKGLNPGDAPRAVFALAGEKPIAVYAYCNLHGLWEKEI